MPVCARGYPSSKTIGDQVCRCQGERKGPGQAKWSCVACLDAMGRPRSRPPVLRFERDSPFGGHGVIQKRGSTTNADLGSSRVAMNRWIFLTVIGTTTPAFVDVATAASPAVQLDSIAAARDAVALAGAVGGAPVAGTVVAQAAGGTAEVGRAAAAAREARAHGRRRRGRKIEILLEGRVGEAFGERCDALRLEIRGEEVGRPGRDGLRRLDLRGGERSALGDVDAEVVSISASVSTGR